MEHLHAGVFTVVQRSRSDLGLYMHLHCIIIDGAFAERVLAQVHKAVAAAAEDDLDLDPALAACVQLGLSGPHLAPPPEPVTGRHNAWETSGSGVAITPIDATAALEKLIP